ncbi:unnamed protein product [Hymenolepis diminuta]|uniref:Uncharacterized protein n=1 Tax=Hymenolepis diminuta TaxID=6216 RepID=A0A564Z5G4_HYMDI|nr:unnamed protein product [Hymenolepis diminuta]
MPTPAQVVSKRMGTPRRTNSQKPAPEADRKNPTGSQSRRRPQGGQGSDTDSGIYQVKSHMIVQRRQPPPKFNRPARDTYFDKVLNNSEDSYDESTENDSFYICEDCKMEEAGQSPYSRRPQHASRGRRSRPHGKYYDEDDEDESLTEDEAASPRERPSGRQPSKSTRSASFRRNRQQKPHPKLEISDRPQNAKAPKQAGPRRPQRDGKREVPRTRREPEYPDFDSNEDEYNSEISVDTKPRRRSGNGRKNHGIKSLPNEAPRRRGKQRKHKVVERKTTTRLSRQNDDDARIRRIRVEDNYSSESWTESSEPSDYSEDTYEPIEVQRRNSRRPNRKEIYEYEEDDPARPQGRQVRPRNKTQGPSDRSLGRRMSTNAEPKMRSMGVRAATART